MGDIPEDDLKMTSSKSVLTELMPHVAVFSACVVRHHLLSGCRQTDSRRRQTLGALKFQSPKIRDFGREFDSCDNAGLISS